MTSYLPGFQSFFHFFVSFCNGQILATSSIRVNNDSDDNLPPDSAAQPAVRVWRQGHPLHLGRAVRNSVDGAYRTPAACKVHTANTGY